VFCVTEKLLTVAEVASQLQIPDSNVRYYRDKFAEYVPTEGEGRSRRFRPEAIPVLRIIAEGMRNSRTARDVAEQLERQFPRSVANEKQLQQLTTTTQQTADFAAMWQQQQEINQNLVELNKRLLALLEQQQQRRPWWKFW